MPRRIEMPNLNPRWVADELDLPKGLKLRQLYLRSETDNPLFWQLIDPESVREKYDISLEIFNTLMKLAINE